MGNEFQKKPRYVEALTGDTSLNARHSGALLTNRGALQAVTVTLPRGEKGLLLQFERIASYDLVLDPYDQEIIIGVDGVSLGAGVVKTLSVDGATCVLFHDGTGWLVISERPILASDLGDATVTGAKMVAGTLAPTKMSFAGLKFGHFVGAAAPGQITLTGAAVGDRVVGGWKSGDASDNNTAGEGAVTTAAAFQALFEATISVVDKIVQTSASDLSDDKYTVILAPAAA